MRLGSLLLEHPLARTPSTLALCALFCLHAARLPARVDGTGNLRSLLDQDRSRWDGALLREGLKLLGASATGEVASPYHLEAAIAAVHARAKEAGTTDWAEIVFLYDLLLRVSPSPVVALNRAIAIGQHQGAERGLEALREITGGRRLERYPFYSAAFAEFEQRLGHGRAAREHFLAARKFARNPLEERFFASRAQSVRS